MDKTKRASEQKKAVKRPPSKSVADDLVLQAVKEQAESLKLAQEQEKRKLN